MPRPSEQTSEPHTLPPAELNPLINPLLAENMGRWAEVYFTSPPENREQAVLDLLRELEAEKSRRDTTLASELAAVPPLVRCRNCGHDNPAVNKFCGMCGADTASSEDSGTAGYSKTPILHDSRSNSPSDPEPERWSERSSSYEEPVAPRHELSLFQAYRETESDDAEQDWNFEPAPSSSYRGYIGAVLAILILGLGYFAWRGMQNSQTSHDISAPPPASASAPSSTTQPPTGNQTAAPPKVDHPEATASRNTNPEAAPADTRNEVPSEPAANEPSAAKAEVPPARPSVPKSSPGYEREVQPESTVDKWGAEELSMAQRYLNGASGQRRDPAEAAKWLWKSIAKHNGQATLLLADMYLRGDGVSKNCDQARVLLDSAARKGVSGAGQRLRNLQAFGCQ